MAGYSFTPPIERDSFLYSDHGLYVEIDGRKQQRASPSVLHGLLTYTPPTGPALTKKGVPAKRQPRPHKDETEYYYRAQLVHYGLKPYKTKAAAKKALLAAFGSGTDLRVPDNILRLEKEMREQWAVEQKKTQARHEQEKAKWREHEEKWAVENRKAQARPQEEIGERREEIEEEEEIDDDKRNRELYALWSLEANGRGWKPRSCPLERHMIQGQWKIVCPHTAEQWPDYAGEPGGFTFTLAFSYGNRNHIWVSFDIGVISGVMRSVGPLPKNVGDTVSFVWRGYEQGEDVMTFDDGNTAAITFTSEGNLKGVINGSFLERDCQFAGLHVDRPNVVWSKSVKGWKATYRGINRASYEQANSGRWGKWTSDEGCGGRADASDTTAAGLASEDEDYGSDDDQWGGPSPSGERGHGLVEDYADKCRRLEKELAAAQKKLRVKDREISGLKARLAQVEDDDPQEICFAY